jgi:hypothetical protein
MKRLAVCGWDERTATLVRAISLRSDLRATAIGDDRAAALVRARAATGLPCYQHVREMLRAVDFDTVLIGDTADREALLQMAAEQQAAILLRGDAADAYTLRAATDAVAMGARSLSVLRPDLGHAGIDLLMSLTNSDANWTPDTIQVEIDRADTTTAAVNTAVALIARLQPEPATQVVTMALRAPIDMVTAMSLQIRHDSSAVSMVTVHDRSQERLRIAIHAPAGLAVLENRAGVSTLSLEPIEGTAEQSELVDDDLVDLEALRITGAHGRRSDERLAPYEAALLAAVEGSLNTGFVAPVREQGARGNLRVLEGGDAATSRREGHLRVVGI